MTNLFKGLIFSLAGTQAKPEDEIRILITKYGGTVQDTINEKVTHVLSSDEMASVVGNSFKLQFFPDFEQQVASAVMYSIPIVSGHFLTACIEQKQIVDVSNYLIFGSSKDYTAQSKLDPRVQDLVRLIFDKSAQQQAILEMSLDSSKISNVTHSSVTAAYKLLSELERAIQMKSVKRSQEEAQRNISDLSRKFYALIPHTSTPNIDSDSLMKEKLSMLEALTDIIVANSLMKDARAGHYSVSPIDVNYKKLKTKITPLEKWTREFDIIKDMVQNSHASIHKWFNIELVDVFEVDRDGEEERFAPFKNLKHHRMLYHGSRLANYVGILSQGLRIAPPEAPVTGYFLGKGVYFADMISKSVEYCRPTKENPYVLMMLCDVALGRPFQLAHTKFISKEDLDVAGYHSVKGCGELGPDPAFDVEIFEGVIASLGKEAPTGVLRSELKHNEFIVYDVAQIRIRYMVKLKVTSESGRDIKALSLLNAN